MDRAGRVKSGDGTVPKGLFAFKLLLFSCWCWEMDAAKGLNLPRYTEGVGISG